MANGYRSPEIYGAGEFDEPVNDPMSADLVRAQLAGGMGQMSELERQILQKQIDSQVTGVGSVEFGERPYWNAEGAFGPRDLMNVVGMGVGGAAGIARAGARGIAQYTGVRSAVEGLRPLGESIFASGSDPSVAARIGAAALGVGGVGTVLAGQNPLYGMDPSELAKMGTPEAQQEITRQYDERAAKQAEIEAIRRDERTKKSASSLQAPEGALIAPSAWDSARVHTDAATMPVAEFMAKYNVLPEKAMTMLEARNQRNPPGAFRRLIGG